jgi:S-(hydroxymethyl)glutathione dehydrogenase / alcohol dehydrogenase
MRAAVLTEFNAPLRIEEVAPDPVGPRQALVRIGASGLCHSDLLFWQGYSPVEPPIVLGHEGAGVVEEVGPEVHAVAPGDRVVCTWMTACGACWFCRRGESRLCEELADQRGERRLTRGDGSAAVPMLGIGTFADHALVDERSLVKVQTDLPDEQLALIGCGVTTGVGAVLNTAAVCPGSSVAVLGCGGVGQSVVQGARIAGATRIVAIDTAPLKRETALALGATDAVDPGAADPVQAVRELTDGRGVDYAFEVAGVQATLTAAYELTRRGGTMVMVAIQPAGEFSWTPFDAVRNEKRVLGCWYGSAEVRRDFPRLIALAAGGRLDVATMVTRRIALDDVNDGMAAIERGEVIRSVIVN